MAVRKSGKTAISAKQVSHLVNRQGGCDQMSRTMREKVREGTRCQWEKGAIVALIKKFPLYIRKL